MIRKAAMQGKWNFLNKTNVLWMENVFEIIIFSNCELGMEVDGGTILRLK